MCVVWWPMVDDEEIENWNQKRLQCDVEVRDGWTKNKKMDGWMDKSTFAASNWKKVTIFGHYFHA